MDSPSNFQTNLAISGLEGTIMEKFSQVCKQNPEEEEIVALDHRVFHKKKTFSRKQIVHTPTTPCRAYINHTQKFSLFGQV